MFCSEIFNEQEDMYHINTDEVELNYKLNFERIRRIYLLVLK